MRLKAFSIALLSVCAFLGSRPAMAVDSAGGLMTAVPVKDGKPPVIDGQLDDWDLSAAEPVYISKQSADLYHVEWAVMYDDDALYLSATASLPGRPLRNPSEPQDAYWFSDCLQVRLGTDPAIPHPLDAKRDEKSDRVAHLTMWHNHDSGKDYLNITRGSTLKGENVTNPAGVDLKFVPHGTDFYVMEARVPWAALNAPGGKKPYKPGERMTGILEALWIGGDSTRVAAVYNVNPATFAFMRPNAWGQIEFAAKGLEKRRRPTMAALLEELKNAPEGDASVGVPIEIDVPEDNLKLSVNIVSDTGAVIRELVGGQKVKKGKAVVKWDGKDAFGHPLQPGTHKWAAYLSGGLKAEYRGALGTAGDPAYQTFDGLGGWGGDHSLPLDVAADDNAYYFLWPVAEAGKAVVKTDLNGKVLWRMNPYVGGGFGPFYAVTVDDKYVYLTLGGDDVRLVRLDKKNGKLLTWNDGSTKELPLYKAKLAETAEIDTPVNARHYKLPALPNGRVGHPDACGMAAATGKLYLSSYSQNKVLIIEAATGKITGEIAVAGPRGLTLGRDGHLYAVSFPVAGPSQVLRLDPAAKSATPVVTDRLIAPYDVAVDAAGNLFVSDLNKSQQVKQFDPSGKFVRAFGKEGGRPYQGKYDGDAFLVPSGLAIDAKGQLLITEAAIPKVFSRLDPTTGSINKRWFGPGVYWNHAWPMPDDPETVFYTLNHGFGLAKPSLKDDGQLPIAYWQPDKAGFDFVGNIEDLIPTPETIKGTNGETYFVRDSDPHLVALLRDHVMRPVAQFDYRPPHIREENKTGKPYIDAWIDANADGQRQDGELSQITKLVDGSPLPILANTVGSFHMEANGDLYFVGCNNTILILPAAGFGSDGMIRWDVSKIRITVPKVLPGQNELNSGFRQGIVGVRRDGQGNLYTLFNARLQGKGGQFDYATPQLAKQMFEGMGHTSGMSAVKFAKYDPSGNLLWMAGRKATAGAKSGEMYHFWNMAGLANDKYIAGGSEWGQIYIYTHDGFFVDALMNNPGDSSPPGPYTFGGETSGGRIAYFPGRDELWAYCSGMAYNVNGFKHGQVVGERRTSGTVQLDKVYDTGQPTTRSAGDITIARAQNDLMKDDASWASVPTTAVLSRGTDKPLATAQLAYDDRFLYVKMHVIDDSPLQNSAENDQMAFKGGDTAGIVLGRSGKRTEPGAGDIRLMLAAIDGKPMVIAMKRQTTGAKKPAKYTTPAAGTVEFEFVGEIPGAPSPVITKQSDGYTFVFAVPRAFLELDLASNSELSGDIEIRLSGAGARGLQTVSRQYLFTPSTAGTTMTDDVPTEARMYPEHWGKVSVK